MLGVSIVFLPLLAEASVLTVTPAVMDLKAKVRDILKESIVLVNNTAKYVEVYPVVSNLFMSESLANWIEFSRAAIALKPGEQKNIDFSIDVNLQAQPGNYHALISFPEGSSRAEAEAKMSNAPSVTINMEVLEDIKERLQLQQFIPDKIFFSDFPISFSYTLENIGNRPLTPLGEIRIYNRKGKEVAAVDANKNQTAIDPDTNVKLASTWDIQEGIGGSGKYKALLDLEYGAKGDRTIQDTVFFWVIPLQQILIVFGALLVIVILGIYFLHRPSARNTPSYKAPPRVLDVKKYVHSWLFVFLFAAISVLPWPARAQGEKLTLSVTPPLFQLTIGAGEFWASQLKVVNVNPYDLTLYASVVNFQSEGEEGHGRFTPILPEDPEAQAYSLAQWIEIAKNPIFVPKEKSVEIPFSVRIPANAPPGGHYAAILVGTQSFSAPAEGAVVQVSSFVSSLFFVRIKGEVKEEGDIREFSTEKNFYQKPEATLTLLFENTGNVHLQPQGDIVMYNMWGKERGKIFVNEKTNFGNVLPQSSRKFTFEWKGEQGFFEAGMYKAIATVSFGSEARQNVYRTTYFWIVPLFPVLGIFGGFIAFTLFLAWLIRSYIRGAVTRYNPRVYSKARPEQKSASNVVDLRQMKRN